MNERALEQHAEPRTTLRRRLDEKLPEILIEAGSVLLALLLAFAANSWHERSEDLERAARARAAIIAELKENRAEVANSRKGVDGMQGELNVALHATQPVHAISLQLGLALVSKAAWHTAQATQVVRNVDYAWVIKVAKVYELQDLYVQAQNRVVEELSDIASAKIETQADVAKQMLGRVNAMADIGKGLDAAYTDVLADQH